MKKKLQGYVLIIFVCLFGIFCSSYVFTKMRSAEKKTFANRFSHQTSSFVYALKERYLRNVVVLEGFRSFIEASNYVSKVEWQEFASGLDLKGEFPAMQWVALVKNLPTELDQKQFLSTFREKEEKVFNIWPDGGKKESAPIIYIYPKNYTNDLLGYDFTQFSSAETVLKSTNGNDIITLPPLVLNPAENRKSGFLLFLPVRAKEQKQLFGWVVSSLDFLVMLDRISKGLKLDNINYKVYDSANISKSSLVFEKGFHEDPEPLYSVTKVITLGDKQWTFAFTSALEYRLESKSSAPWLVLMLFLCIIAALCFFLYRALFTVSLVESLQNHPVMDTLKIGISIFNLDGKFILINKAASEVFSVIPAEVLEKKGIVDFLDKEEMSRLAASLSTELSREVKEGIDVFIALAETHPVDGQEWTLLLPNGVKKRVILDPALLKNTEGLTQAVLLTIRSLQVV